MFDPAISSEHIGYERCHTCPRIASVRTVLGYAGYVCRQCVFCGQSPNYTRELHERLKLDEATVATEMGKARDNWTYDRVVRSEDARPAGSPGECFYCSGILNSLHRPDCVILKMRRLEAAPIGVWQPIETYEDGDYVLFWFPEGDRGNGAMEPAMIFHDDDGSVAAAWTEGGPNSGSDIFFDEDPTMWCRLPDPPKNPFDGCALRK